MNEPASCDTVTEFQCAHNGRCISANKECDKQIDCADESDEPFCGKYLIDRIG